MKTNNFLKLFLLASLMMPATLWAANSTANKKSSAPASANSASYSHTENANLGEDIDSLGGNQELLMAQKIKSETRSRIVQERLVNRNNRLELGMSYGGVIGGDSYLKTQSASLQLDWHITPRWSLGARYIDFSNSLTSEGRRVFDLAQKNYLAGGTAYAVDVDYPINEALAVINWYPIYGKTSFLDLGITQFDFYFLAGGGQITLSSGSTGVVTAGGGIAAWITKHLTARAELRYQSYEDLPVTGSRQLNTGVATVGLGWIL